MPFTLAHPLAVVPFRRWLGRFGVLSALVIGSMSPDLPYFSGGAVSGRDSHSLRGIVLICLPAGLLSYVLFHAFLKGPILALLPTFLRTRLGTHSARFGFLPAEPWTSVVVSLLIGAISHVAWDGFTHFDGFGVAAVPILKARLLSIGTYDLHGYGLLQHGSTMAGLAILSLLSWKAVMSRPSEGDLLPLRLSPRWRVVAIMGVGSVPVILGIYGAYPGEIPDSIADTRLFIGRGIFGGLPALAVTVLAYSAVWHALSRHSRRRGAATVPSNRSVNGTAD